jgi:putative DNA primase/helicase
MNIESIIRALSAQRSGSCWMARCPAHDDRNPSRSIREADGKVLLHCHAGCTQRSVIDALAGRGLWQPEPIANTVSFRQRCVTRCKAE